MAKPTKARVKAWMRSNAEAAIEDDIDRQMFEEHDFDAPGIYPFDTIELIAKDLGCTWDEVADVLRSLGHQTLDREQTAAHKAEHQEWLKGYKAEQSARKAKKVSQAEGEEWLRWGFWIFVVVVCVGIVVRCSDDEGPLSRCVSGGNTLEACEALERYR